MKLGSGQTQALDDKPPDQNKVYTTERPDGLLVATKSRPVGFGPSVESWDLQL